MSIWNDITDTINRTSDTSKSEEEQCWLLINRNERIVPIYVPNRHPLPREAFRVLREDVDAALEPADSLVGIAHTHTRPGTQEPSYEDVKALPDGMLGLVVHPASKTWTLFNNTVGVVAFFDGSNK